MERIVIIDHDRHELFIEDIDEKTLQEKYNGEEEDYIKDNYDLSEHWSWDYVNAVWYCPQEGDASVWFNNQYLDIPE